MGSCDHDGIGSLSLGRARYLLSKFHNRFFLEVCPVEAERRLDQPLLQSYPVQLSQHPEPKLKLEPADSTAEQTDITQSQAVASSTSEDQKASRLSSTRKRNKTSKMNRPSNRLPKIDVLVITALPEELDAVLECTDNPKEPYARWHQSTYGQKPGFTYYYQSFTQDNGSPFTVATACAPQMGETYAASTASALVTQFNPKCLAMVGICAGRRDDVRLGDIIVANRVYKYDAGAVKANYEGGIRQEHILGENDSYKLNPIWEDRIKDKRHHPIWTDLIGITRPRSYEHQELWVLYRLLEHEQDKQNCVSPAEHPERELECPDWKDILPRLREKKLVKTKKIELTPRGKNYITQYKQLHLNGYVGVDSPEPTVHLAPMATGSKVQRDPKLFECLSVSERKVLGVEMEGSAIGAVSWMSGTQMLIIKGVSDYGDDDKNDNFRNYAARAAARFLISFLKKHLS